MLRLRAVVSRELPLVFYPPAHTLCSCGEVRHRGYNFERAIRGWHQVQSSQSRPKNKRGAVCFW
ncbi:hypothetical protein M430DRAFT_164118 [Amorphotheca resinae ATCC 22711]|uniref:Uncharacterized protein n=1 Tax=Amorphotheca resinae ATCC 22711 TaxID=857342 RepID=A0A2T3BFI9_AMORE|nr:hypothetical protein M430DRAFT_164118 [Amorphotheca resinae ATCC 22711]PSS28187.1 hypothetical protein M430DRAFT_164118 [Amorphotheca resinae ATCC 22711]